ncbi:Trmo [Symbiodinium sp. KB8]|nr:Trmo [Symbiodinium sp. KB8]
MRSADRLQWQLRGDRVPFAYEAADLVGFGKSLVLRPPSTSSMRWLISVAETFVNGDSGTNFTMYYEHSSWDVSDDAARGIFATSLCIETADGALDSIMVRSQEVEYTETELLPRGATGNYREQAAVVPFPVMQGTETNRIQLRELDHQLAGAPSFLEFRDEFTLEFPISGIREYLITACGKDRKKTFCASMANDGDEDDGHDSDVAEEQQYLVHIRNVPKTSSLSDVNALFVRAGFSPPFSFRISDSIVAVQLDSSAAVEAAMALDGSMLTPPPVDAIPNETDSRDVFAEISQKKPTVRPPWLAGDDGRRAKRGVFATRSPHRPNPVGLTLCRLDSIDQVNSTIYISGVDVVDGSAVLDIKPYHPVESFGPGHDLQSMAQVETQAIHFADWLPKPQPCIDILWSDAALTELQELQEHCRFYPDERDHRSNLEIPSSTSSKLIRLAIDEALGKGLSLDRAVAAQFCQGLIASPEYEAPVQSKNSGGAAPHQPPACANLLASI